MFSLPHLFFPTIHRIATCAHKSIYVMKYTCKRVAGGYTEQHIKYTCSEHGQQVVQHKYMLWGLVAGGRIDWGAYSLFMLYTPHHTQPNTTCYNTFAQHNVLHHTAQRYTQALQVSNVDMSKCQMSTNIDQSLNGPNSASRRAREDPKKRKIIRI